MIVSASRRTDIPAFYSEWFMKRVRAGFCTVPNPFNADQVSTVSLLPEDVDALVFWTRNPRPMLRHLNELDERGYDYIFQMTLLDYPRWLETNTPPAETAIATFGAVSEHVGPARIIWRYDPLVFTRTIDAGYHRQKFGELADALHGHTERVVISVVDDYAKTRHRLGRAGRGDAAAQGTYRGHGRVRRAYARPGRHRGRARHGDPKLRRDAGLCSPTASGPASASTTSCCTRLFGLDLDGQEGPDPTQGMRLHRQQGHRHVQLMSLRLPVLLCHGQLRHGALALWRRTM